MTDSESNDEDETEAEDEKRSIEQRVRAHIERRRDAYVKMGTVDSDE